MRENESAEFLYANYRRANLVYGISLIIVILVLTSMVLFTPIIETYSIGTNTIDEQSAPSEPWAVEP